jgi:hypothetical protein
MAESINFRPFQTSDTKAFKALNVEWLEAYFEVEPYDELVLSNPQSEILEKGGKYFYGSERKENHRYFCFYQKR